MFEWDDGLRYTFDHESMVFEQVGRPWRLVGQAPESRAWSAMAPGRPSRLVDQDSDDDDDDDEDDDGTDGDDKAGDEDAKKRDDDKGGNDMGGDDNKRRRLIPAR